MSVPAAVPAPTAPARRRVRLPFRGDPLGRFGLALLVLLLTAGLLGPLLPIGSATESVGPRLLPPGGEYLLGTDELGRSLLPRVTEGIRETILISSVVVAVAAVVGVLLGCFAALAGRRTDELIVRLTDVVFAFPVFLVSILVSVAAGPGRPAAMAAVLAVTLPTMVRVVRSAALPLVERDFVVAAEVAGASRARILVVHLLPNVRDVVIGQVAYAMSLGMLVEGGMSFLGLGVQAPAASLGSLVGSGRLYLTVDPAYALVPGFVLGLAVLAFNLVGDALRRQADPLDQGES
ncbi:ABC transporter permease [Patulibacter sp. SYSU D01012]|uniref:ABC transporter permease n=1 Tax=Patulibacter sp. SYSU D01012 TaxID=2817381 RepID=UPI001B304FA0|nr:ABC transporter permease [Patulibacter sp. SYSU D01012]